MATHKRSQDRHRMSVQERKRHTKVKTLHQEVKQPFEAAIGKDLEKNEAPREEAWQLFLFTKPACIAHRCKRLKTIPACTG